MKAVAAVVAAIAAVVVLLYVATTPTVPPAEMTEADLNIDQLLINYVRTAEAGDWDSWSNLWTEDAIYMVPGAPVLEGRAAIRASLDAFPSPPSRLRVRLSNDPVGFGNWAWVRGSYEMTMPAFEDTPEMTEVGKFLWILEKGADGVWLIDSECYNSDSPLPMPPDEG